MAAETRQQLVARLTAERDPGALGPYVHHAAWQVRWAAIESLGKSGSPDAEGHLLEVLRSPTDDQDLPLASAAIGKIGSKAAIPFLSALIHHPTEDVKASAIHALGVLGGASLTPTYLDALSDRSWVAKWYAMAAIARHADDRAITPVSERVRAILRRNRRRNIAGMTELSYGLGYLKRWQTTNPTAAATIEWVRDKAFSRLDEEERAWFERTFGESP